mmetsp:Transcript_36320/g.67561  ORF Transcript_36320/g.67561 Transcript_36320/m.67561 type:complete len:324 (+) Transcript_36320:213-1184(+)
MMSRLMRERLYLLRRVRVHVQLAEMKYIASTSILVARRPGIDVGIRRLFTCFPRINEGNIGQQAMNTIEYAHDLVPGPLIILAKPRPDFASSVVSPYGTQSLRSVGLRLHSKLGDLPLPGFLRSHHVLHGFIAVSLQQARGLASRGTHLVDLWFVAKVPQPSATLVASSITVLKASRVLVLARRRYILLDFVLQLAEAIKACKLIWIKFASVFDILGVSASSVLSSHDTPFRTLAGRPREGDLQPKVAVAHNGTRHNITALLVGDPRSFNVLKQARCRGWGNHWWIICVVVKLTICYLEFEWRIDAKQVRHTNPHLVQADIVG